MHEVKGKYGSAVIFTENIEEEAENQILEVCNMPYSAGCVLKIMPDVHAGKGCVIGFTGCLDRMVPSLVGVDIACGVLCVELGTDEISLPYLDEIINERIPSGFNVHQKAVDHTSLECSKLMDRIGLPLSSKNRIERSIGTLGGGNHFIEVDEDGNRMKYLLIHSGSRNLGLQVFKYYDSLTEKESVYDKSLRDQTIKYLKSCGREKEIEEYLKTTNSFKYPKNLAPLPVEYEKQYLADMQTVSEYSYQNRAMIANIILNGLGITKRVHTNDPMFYPWNRGINNFTTLHNYIDINGVVRKGAVASYKNSPLIIPLNMKDGALICEGKSNTEWNNSAPHGAGRLMSRKKAFESLDLENYKKLMDGIYSTSICEATLDEAPMAYKNADDIVKDLGETASLIKVIKPIYNFKDHSKK